MEWDGAINARHVAGDVFAMGRRERLTELGWQQVWASGVRSVVDLRNPQEQSRRDTDPVVDAAHFARFSIVNCPTEDPANEEFRAVCVPYLNHPRSYADNLRLFPELVTGVFHQLAHADGAVVIHCSAGRDRSGLIATMMLKLAGATQSTIAQQYEESVRGINAWHKISPIKHPYEKFMTEEQLQPWLSERVAALADFSAELNVEGYLLRHSLAQTDLAALKDRLAL
ncbi:MAG: tyrosine-protein phosphatase [Acidobacteria bacterium]|nr:tyrosine-protein phosphatase [Acidobacteriota bacterium]